MPASENEPTELELQDYLFDLNGFFTVQQAISEDQRQAILSWIDAHPASMADAAKFETGEEGQWIGDVEVQSYMSQDGVNYQNIIEGGDVFEQMIDNPRWIDHVRRYLGPGLTGKNISLNECLLNVRASGGYIGLHSGGHLPWFSSVFHHPSGEWGVGQLNVITALEDIGPGDGGTTIVPGSHKSCAPHPHFKRQEHPDQNVVNYSGPAGEAENMVELHLKAGDSLIFTDGVAHGSSARTNPGSRKIMLFRYCSTCIATRWNYLASPELMARLTPARREIVQPVKPRLCPSWRKAMHKTP